MRKHHNKLYYGKYRHKTVFKLPGSLMFYPTTDEHLTKLKKEYSDAPDLNHLASFIMANRKDIKFRMQDRRSIFYSDFEKANIVRALEETDWTVGGAKGAAALLQMKPTTLASRIKAMNINRF